MKLQVLTVLISCCIVPYGGVCAGLSARHSGGKGETLPQIVLVDGESFQGRLVSIPARSASSGRTVSTAVFQLLDGNNRNIPLRDLWRIRYTPPEQAMNKPHRIVVSLSNGGVVAVRQIILKNGKATFRTDLLGSAVVDMSLLRTIYFSSPGQCPRDVKRRIEQMGPLSTTQDYLVAENQRGEWIPVPGVLKEIDTDRVIFQYDRVNRVVGRNYVHMIQLADLGRGKFTPAGEIIGKDGSIVPFESLRFDKGKMTITCGDLKDQAVSLEGLAEIRFRSDRFVYLSDLTPAKCEQAGLFDIAFPFKRDRSCTGGPLKLAGTTYAKGLGLHSRCIVSYELGENFNLLVALAGIDDSTGGKGNAEVRILADGKDIIEPVILTGGSKPVPLRCKIDGVKRLTIQVDFGPDGLDVGDRVDLVEARLVRK